MTKSFKPKIVSANDLLEGDVVYLDRDHNWTRRVNEAALATTAVGADELLTRANQPARVVGPYLLDVTLDGERIQPEHFRERFRDTGPTVGPQFSRVRNEEPQALTPSKQGNP